MNCLILNRSKIMGLPELEISYNTSDHDIDTEFYLPCLAWATQFDRGVGYFTTGWISKNAYGLSQMIVNGGTARWITSPILEEKDYEIINSLSEKGQAAYIENICEQGIEQLRREMENDARNSFAWMIHDKVLEIRFAIPRNKLEGDFHTKFGIFYGCDGQTVAFEGSNNDSKKGFTNYESFMVFMSWKGMHEYVEVECRKFNKLWNGLDKNIQIFKMSEAVRQNIFTLRTGERPYQAPGKVVCEIEDKWRHQEEAKQIFLKAKNGILAMATGTGKTFTAIKIMKHLIMMDEIDKIIIIVDGNELLRQWYLEVMENFQTIRVFQMYEQYRQVSEFLMCRKKCVLLLSRRSEYIVDCLSKVKRNDSNALKRTLLVFDEVHGIGSNKLSRDLKGKIGEFQYRLGLSATPQRPFDEAGNFFIEEEIGKIIYEFKLEDAIQRGILCEMNYIPLPYELTVGEKEKKRDIIAGYEMKKKRGEGYDDTELYRKLAMVNKLAHDKLVQFALFICNYPEILNRSIIFVETMEYGLQVQEILSEMSYDYHTYYADDDVTYLEQFSKGQIECLITCKKISEGVDIKTVKSVILFSSERGRLVTTQRIGRSLRWNPEDPEKRANVVDFICTKSEEEGDYETESDRERKEWLQSLAEVRRNENL